MTAHCSKRPAYRADVRDSAADLNILEALVDKHGIAGVLNLLADICGDKAEHIAVNWQDTRSAKVWERDAGLIGALSSNVS